MSTTDAKFSGLKIVVFYLDTPPHDRYEYMKMSINIFPTHHRAVLHASEDIRWFHKYIQSMYGCSSVSGLKSQHKKVPLIPILVMPWTENRKNDCFCSFQTILVKLMGHVGYQDRGYFHPPIFYVVQPWR